MKRTLIQAGLVAAIVTFGGLAAAQGPEDLNDLEIAHVAFNAGLVDIRYAHQALATSETPEIRAFAELMIQDHDAVNRAALALLEQLNAAPRDNEVSAGLLAQAAELRAELRGLDGDAFDRRYAENELAYHQFVNTTLETVFIPNVQTAALRELLEDALATFKVHEEHARMMVGSLSSS